MPDPVYGTPVLVAGDRSPVEWLTGVPGEPLAFATREIGRPFDPVLKPIFSTTDQYYSVYWDVFTETEWQARQAEYEEVKARERKIAEATIDDFRIGEMQPERDHNLRASERSYVEAALGRAGREARRDNYFSFDMRVEPDARQSLLLTYLGDDKNRKFDILVDGVKLATVDWAGGMTGRFYDFEYPLPKELLAGKSAITVKIEANHGKTAGRVFGCRTIRK
jgi:hypothetical protein